jgi:hypothetical protein
VANQKMLVLPPKRTKYAETSGGKRQSRQL